jgi:hypothetical protein
MSKNGSIMLSRPFNERLRISQEFKKDKAKPAPKVRGNWR